MRSSLASNSRKSIPPLSRRARRRPANHLQYTVCARQEHHHLRANSQRAPPAIGGLKCETAVLKKSSRVVLLIGRPVAGSRKCYIFICAGLVSLLWQSVGDLCLARRR